jgi:putative holliday junction resolvase
LIKRRSSFIVARRDRMRKSRSNEIDIVLALDYGKSRVGVAVSDGLGELAHPRDPLDGHQRGKLLAEIASLAKGEGAKRILIGLPLDMHGGAGTAAKRVVAFAQSVADATRLEVELVDERLTTTEAHKRLTMFGVTGSRRKAVVDGMAAAILLQSWLDARRSTR